jgi:hypothetical protein
MKIVPITIENHVSIKIYENENYSWGVRCEFFYEAHKWKIITFLILLLSGVISLIVILSKTKTSSSSSGVYDNPCENYKDDDYASGVSLSCLRQLWDIAGCITKGKGTIPDGYNGWWLRSPSGGKMVLCVPPNTGDRCGAGNFGIIRNMIFVCDLNYRGY